MAEITQLHSGANAIGPEQPVIDVIEMLEGLMAEARRGIIRQFAYVAIRANTDYRTGFGGDGRMLAILGAVAVLQNDIAHELAERMVDSGA